MIHRYAVQQPAVDRTTFTTVRRTPSFLGKQCTLNKRAMPVHFDPLSCTTHCHEDTEHPSGMHPSQAQAQQQMRDSREKQQNSVDQATTEEAVVKKRAPRLRKAPLHKLRMPRANQVFVDTARNPGARSRHRTEHYNSERVKPRRRVEAAVAPGKVAEPQERRQGDKNAAA